MGEHGRGVLAAWQADLARPIGGLLAQVGRALGLYDAALSSRPIGVLTTSITPRLAKSSCIDAM